MGAAVGRVRTIAGSTCVLVVIVASCLCFCR